MAKESKKTTILISEVWKRTPRKMLLGGVWISVGGKIGGIQEATPAQYRELAKYLPAIIQVVEAPEEPKKEDQDAV